MMKSKYYIAIIIALVLCLAYDASAAPPNPRVRELAQPDGSVFKAKLLGNDYFSCFETVDGYTIIKGSDGWWRYAECGENGALVAGNVVVNFDGAVLEGISKHARPSKKVLNESLKKANISVVNNEAQAAAITGTAKVLVILIQFPDQAATQATSHYDSLLFASQSGSMRDYYQTVSFDAFDIQGTIGGSAWLTANNNMAWYGEDDGSSHDTKNGVRYKLAKEAVEKLDAAGFDFAPYDTDADGFVDHVIIVHAGDGQEDSGVASDLWSYSGYIGSSSDDAVAVDGVKVFRFTLQAESSPMGVFAHEFFHDLGGPDMYDTSTGESLNGNWTLMDHGLWTGDPAGSSPAFPGAYLMRDIDGLTSTGVEGWLTISELSTDGTYSLLALASDSSGGTRAYKINYPGESQKYYIIENRYRLSYDSELPGQGLIIWRIDESNLNNAGSPYLAEIVNAANTNTTPPKGGAAFSSGSGYTTFTNSTNPASDSSAINIYDIGAAGQSISFTFSTSDSSVSVSSDPTTTSPPAPTSSTGGSGGGGCFLATAAYEKVGGKKNGSVVSNFTGSYVLTTDRLKKLNSLRKFRDEKLLQNETGRTFVRTYYTLAPAAAEAIRGNEPAKRAVRLFVIQPLVKMLEK